MLKPKKTVTVKDQSFGSNQPLGLILGPCMLESYELIKEVATYLKDHLEHPFIFKASFDKANRSSIETPRGPGIDRGLEYLQKLKDELNLAVTTDIHLPEHAAKAAQVVDIIQVPAFLARQTDLVVEAAKTGLPVHVKKAQFMAPQDMEHVAGKILESGNDQIIFTDRGTSFGYHNLVNDFRGMPLMKDFCSATCYDVTHSGQMPGLGKESGGQTRFMLPLSKAAIAAGCDMIFCETHPNPAKALSDSKTQLPLTKMPEFINELVNLRHFLISQPSCV